MKSVASHVGFHSLTTLHIENDWRRVPLNRLFYAAPALRFVETLYIRIGRAKSSSRIASVYDVNSFTEQFPRLRRLYLGALEKPVFDWCSFLQSECARKLPDLLVDGPNCVFKKADGSSSQAKECDFLEYCFDCSRLAERVGKFVRLPSCGFVVSRNFLATSLEVIRA